MAVPQLPLPHFIFMLIRNSALRLGLLQPGDEQFHRVGRVHVVEHAAEDADAAVFFGVHAASLRGACRCG